MSEELFDVVFFGILQADRDRDVVIQNMAQLFKTDPEKLAPYFSGGRKVIKGKLNAQTAEKYRAALENAGLVIKIEPCENKPAEAQSTQAKAAEANIEAATEPVRQPTRPEQTALEADTGNITMAPVGADVITSPVEVPAQQIADISNITMAEVGVDVIENPVKQAAQEIADISDLTMAEAGSDIITHHSEVNPQKIKDISDITMAKPGTDITTGKEHN